MSYVWKKYITKMKENTYHYTNKSPDYYNTRKYTPPTYWGHSSSYVITTFKSAKGLFWSNMNLAGKI